jgi:hypothetical protein
MPLLSEITESIVRVDSAGIFTDENRAADYPYIDYLINNARGLVVAEDWKKNKRIDAGNLQIITLKKINTLQDSDCYVRFEIPNPLMLDRNNDGFRFVGSATENIQYMRARSRGEASVFRHRVTTFNNPKFVTWLYDGQYIEVYGNPDIEKIKIEAIFENPLLIPNFNVVVDEYPISNDLIPLVEIYVKKNYMDFIYSKQPDMISSSEDVKPLPPVRL